MAYYLVSHIKHGMDNETGEVYVNTALFNRIKPMKKYIKETLLAGIVDYIVINEHHRKQRKSYERQTDLSPEELETAAKAKLDSIDLDSIIAGTDFDVDNDERERISVNKLSLNSGETTSLVD